MGCLSQPLRACCVCMETRARARPAPTSRTAPVTSRTRGSVQGHGGHAQAGRKSGDPAPPARERRGQNSNTCGAPPHRRPASQPPSLSAHALPQNSESLALKNLKDCSVYILDHSSEVEATGCTNCELFIGPVDGPALFADCAGCTVAVAAQQFQARRCADTTFSLFCGTAPSVSGCADLTFTCWSGAYPGLGAHFRAAGLDPAANAWDKVHDSGGEGGGGEGGEGGVGGGGGGGAPSFKVVRDRGAAW